MYSCERMLKTDTEEKKLLNKAIIFVFFVHKYSHSQVKRSESLFIGS